MKTMDKSEDKLNYELIGIGKTLFNSSCARFNGTELEVLLTERLNKKKYSGEWPWRGLSLFEQRDNIKVSECRDVISSSEFEHALNNHSPFFEFLQRKDLSKFKSSSQIESLTHHYAHALSAVTFTKLDKAIICVVDGAGTNSKNFNDLIHLETESKFLKGKDSYEGLSFYLYENESLYCVEKKFYPFYKSKTDDRVYSNSLGMIFEYVSELIFNSKHDAGKVMGLSAFGQAKEYSCVEKFIEDLDWSKKFLGTTKDEWESSVHLSYYKNLAASVQKLFERNLLFEIGKYSTICENLIIAGGAAMNCVSNMNIVQSSLFKHVEVPPCPGDEGISIGLVQYLYSKKMHTFLRNYSPYLGKIDNDLSLVNIEKVFHKYNVEKLGQKLIPFTSQLLVDGKIIGWFQGRSEIGARALGNRSILARIDRNNLKSYLNQNIKFREEFRPYACSVLSNYAGKYFLIPDIFDSPYMSFTIPVKKEWQSKFKEVVHIDGTSRAQIVSREMNEKYYDLISSVGNQTGVYALLNTSLNVMGQPIVETLDDLLLFLETSNVDGVIVGDFYVSR